MRGRRKGEEGLTLVELLVAVAILSIIVTTAYSLFSQSAQLAGAVRERSELYLEARLVLERIASDLSNARLIGGDERFYFVGLDEARGATPRDRLQFTALAYGWPSEGEKADELVEISYWVEDAPGTAEPRLMRRAVRTLDGLPETPHEAAAPGELLSERVRGMELEFHDARGGKADDWDTRIMLAGSSPQLPRAVRVSLIFEGERGRREFSTTVTIPSGLVWSPPASRAPGPSS